jgi:hypothetical protein
MRSPYMNNLNVVGVDLVKNIIQISVVTRGLKELQNKALTRKKFSAFLARQKPSLVASRPVQQRIGRRERAGDRRSHATRWQPDQGDSAARMPGLRLVPGWILLKYVDMLTIRRE